MSENDTVITEFGATPLLKNTSRKSTTVLLSSGSISFVKVALSPGSKLEKLISKTSVLPMGLEPPLAVLPVLTVLLPPAGLEMIVRLSS